MAGWFEEKARPAILQAVEAACNRLDADLATEFQKKEHERHEALLEEIERLQARTTRVDTLEAENRALRMELLELRSRPRGDEDENNATTPSEQNRKQPGIIGATHVAGDSSTTGPRALAESPRDSAPDVVHGDLDSPVPSSKPTHGVSTGLPAARSEATRHVGLAARYKHLRDQCEAAILAGRKRTQERDEWMRYAESLEAKLERLGKKPRAAKSVHASRRANDTPRPVLGDLDPGRRATEGRHDALPGSAESVFLKERYLPEPGSPFVGWPRQTEYTAEAVGPTNPDAAILLSVERDHRAPGPRKSAEEVSTTNPLADELQGAEKDKSLEVNVIVKRESSSDTPRFVSGRSVRKRKAAADAIDTTERPRRIKTEDLSSDPIITGDLRQFSPHESLDLDDHSAVPTPRKNIDSHSNAPNQEELTSDDEFCDAGIRSRAANETRTGLLVHKESQRPPLAPISANATPRSRQTLQSNKAHPLFKKLRDITTAAEQAYDSLHEKHEAATVDGSSSRTRLVGRLDALLNSPSPNDDPPLLNPRQKRRRSAMDSNITVPPRRQLPFSHDGPQKGERIETPNSIKSRPPPQTARRPARGIATPTTVAPTPRLRDTPVARLRVEDFKINPKFSGGMDYAFSDVVRKKAEREELAACVDPNCCGKNFRAMALSELAAAGPATVRSAASVSILEEYLGDQAYRLASMTQEEREETWLAARTRELANKHGKHRQRFHRRPSPPGFWNADFPSTQENERDRIEGEKMQRRMVDERWREAMRESGRWLFRDE